MHTITTKEKLTENAFSCSVQARLKAWQAASPKSLRQFIDPPPGRPRAPAEEFEGDPPNQEEGPVDNFCLVTLDPKEVRSERASVMGRRIKGSSERDELAHFSRSYSAFLPAQRVALSEYASRCDEIENSGDAFVDIGQSLWRE